jgi:hypothetical protein
VNEIVIEIVIEISEHAGLLRSSSVACPTWPRA